MLGYVLLWGAILLPLALGLAFRVGTSHLFFALMAGELLGRYFGHDLDKFLPGAAGEAGVGEIIFILIAVLVTAYLLRGTLSKRRLLMHVVPLLITGVIAAAFILPVLPAALQEAVRGVELGDTLLSLHRAIIGTMIGLQLGWLWFQHGRKGKRENG